MDELLHHDAIIRERIIGKSVRTTVCAEGRDEIGPVRVCEQCLEAGNIDEHLAKRAADLEARAATEQNAELEVEARDARSLLIGEKFAGRFAALIKADLNKAPRLGFSRAVRFVAPHFA
jgi:hypothetical protein